MANKLVLLFKFSILGVVNGIIGIFGEGKSQTEIMGEMIEAQTEQILNKIDEQTEILIKYMENFVREI